MTVPLLTLYLVGIIFFILGLESKSDKTTTILYMGLSFAVNLMAYLLSYGDVDYLSVAYLPLILMIISILLLLYTAWNQLPGMNWDENENTHEKEI